MKQKLTITLSIILAATILFFACKEEELPKITSINKIELNITEDSISYVFAEIKCDLNQNPKFEIEQYGFCWDTVANVTIEKESNNFENLTSQSFTETIENLFPNKTYYVKAYIQNGDVIIYSNELTIQTLDARPIVTTTDISNITANSAQTGGTVTAYETLFPITQRGVCWAKTQNPTIADSLTNNGTGNGIFTSQLQSLDIRATYYVRGYAINIAGTSYGENESFTTLYGIVTDYDGNTYNTVQIGNQIWMAENLKTTNYANGTAIPLVTDNTAWVNLGDNNTDDAYCYYNNDANSQYGALYTWAAAMNSATSSSANPSGIQGACPDGWHLPSDAEWTELTDYLGGASVAGDKMKEIGTTHWISPNTGATNESGFTALPGGYRSSSGGSFGYAGGGGYWWSSTEYNSTSAYFRDLDYDYAGVGRFGTSKSFGFSVRCIKD
ncbi:MAG: hypothetical protein PWP52_1013 [Bacteroidales bacterium]|nr:hypothetical protein [Bacteroidales bacterium]